MNHAAAAVLPARRLRVSIYAADPGRLAALRTIVIDAGHEIVEPPESADVILSDGDCPAIDGPPCVTPAQIDAALRVAAAGLIVRSVQEPGGFAAMSESEPRVVLTPREIEVLAAIGEGLSNKMIARRLDISLHTVKFHIESLFRKLAVRTRTQALAKALERRQHIVDL